MADKNVDSMAKTGFSKGVAEFQLDFLFFGGYEPSLP